MLYETEKINVIFWVFVIFQMCRVQQQRGFWWNTTSKSQHLIFLFLFTVVFERDLVFKINAWDC